MTFTEIIELWPSQKDLAEDLGLTNGAITNMKRRNSIEYKHWDTIIESAKRRKLRINRKILNKKMFEEAWENRGET